MNIDVYQSTKNTKHFLSVPHGFDVSKLNLSAAELAIYQKVSTFKRGLTADTTDERIAMNSSDIIAQIKSKGYALHGAAIVFNESV